MMVSFFIYIIIYKYTPDRKTDDDLVASGA